MARSNLTTEDVTDKVIEAVAQTEDGYWRYDPEAEDKWFGIPGKDKRPSASEA